MAVFNIGDPHFTDPRILRYCRRNKFSNVHEMDEYMIMQWNKTVKANDKVFIHGDMCLSNNDDDYSFIRRLNGRKTLIRGNHDNKDTDFYLKQGIYNVYDYPIIYNDIYILSHCPTFVNINMPYVNVYGHIHDNLNYNKYSACGYCVSVEVIDYTPINFDAISKSIGDKRKEIDAAFK